MPVLYPGDVIPGFRDLRRTSVFLLPTILPGVRKIIFAPLREFAICTRMLRSYYCETRTEAGCDEAGRGCFAGPVFAAAVILPKGFAHPLLNDSKQVNRETREELRRVIEREAVSFAVASLSPKEIDRYNILRASFKAMHRAIDKLQQPPELLLIDGNRFNRYKKTEHLCVIKGDGIYAPIAAASILAKTYRDDYMRELSRKFPHYGWESNKGYGTAEHREALKRHGTCKHHRQSFRLFGPPELFGEDEVLTEPEILPQAPVHGVSITLYEPAARPSS